MVEQVMEFNYLGVNITSSGNLVKEIKTQAQKAARVAGCLHDLVWRKNKYKKKETTSKIYKATNHTPDYDICTTIVVLSILILHYNMLY